MSAPSRSQIPRQSLRYASTHLPAPAGRCFLFPYQHGTLVRWMGPSLSLTVLARRKPKLLLRLPGVFLLRFAERQFRPLLFQLPPRLTRFVPEPGPASLLHQPPPFYTSTLVVTSPRKPQKRKIPMLACTDATKAEASILPPAHSRSRMATSRRSRHRRLC